MSKFYNFDKLKDIVHSKSRCELIEFKRSETSHIILSLKCECGELFSIKKKHFDKGKIKCNKCNGINRWNIDNLKLHVNNNSECEFISFKKVRKNGTTIIMDVKCKCGNIFSVSKNSFDNGQIKCKSCNNFSSYYGISLLEFKPEICEHWDYDLNTLLPNEISYMSSKKVWIKCENKKHESTYRIVNVYSKGSSCIHCSLENKESRLARSLKLVFKYLYKNTIWEARLGAKSKNNKEMPYDIYIPELNLIIECQSKFHDNDDQKERDEIKINYALENGYEIICLDNRFIEVNDFLVKYFGDNIPFNDILDTNINTDINTMINWDISKVQKLLDNTTMNYNEISKEVNVPVSTISSAVSKGVLHVDDNRIYNRYPKKRKVKQLSLDGELLNIYDSITDAEKVTGCKVSNISSCCRGKIRTLGGYKWEYLN